MVEQFFRKISAQVAFKNPKLVAEGKKATLTVSLTPKNGGALDFGPLKQKKDFTVTPLSSGVGFLTGVEILAKGAKNAAELGRAHAYLEKHKIE